LYLLYTCVLVLRILIKFQYLYKKISHSIRSYNNLRAPTAFQTTIFFYTQLAAEKPISPQDTFITTFQKRLIDCEQTPNPQTSKIKEYKPSSN
jgi:hypothetical protein